MCYSRISDLNYTEDWCNFPSHYIYRRKSSSIIHTFTYTWHPGHNGFSPVNAKEDRPIVLGMSRII